MKKMLLAVLAVAALATASFAGDFGLGLKIGGGQNDPKDLKEAFDYFGGELTKSPAMASLEGLYEWNIGGEELDEIGSANKMGVRLGLDVYGQNKYERLATKVTENTVAIPVSLYYKRDGGIKSASFYIGGGVTALYTFMDITTADDLDNTKIFPHVMAGVEYRFSKLFALGLDFKYNINAKNEKDGVIISDRSGLQGALVARFYF